LAPPREGAPARLRTRRSRLRPCLGPRVRTARAGSPLAGRGCHHTRGLGIGGSREAAIGGAYKSPPGMRIARSDGGTRPSSRLPKSALQRNGSCASLLTHSSKPRGRAAVRAHMYVSAVSAEIVAGTLPEKRFWKRFLCRSVPVQHARVGWETARRRRGVQVGQPGERRDAREDRAGEAVLAQGPDRAQRGMRPRRRWTAHAQPLRSRSDAGAASAASPAARRGRTGQ
jgi:hypothetical protein